MESDDSFVLYDSRIGRIPLEILIKEGVKAEEEYAKSGKLPDSNSTDYPGIQFALEIIKYGIQTHPKGYTEMKESLAAFNANWMSAGLHVFASSPDAYLTKSKVPDLVHCPIAGQLFLDENGSLGNQFRGTLNPSNNVEDILGKIETKFKMSAEPNKRTGEDHSRIDMLNLENGHTDNVKKKSDDDAMMKIAGTIITICGQFIAGVMANRATTSAAAPRWAGPTMEFLVVLGMSITLSGIIIREKAGDWSTRMTKTGAILTALAIIISMALHLNPVAALTAGPAAFFTLATSVAYA